MSPYFYFQNVFFSEPCAVFVEKCCTSGHTTDGNMAHVHFMPGNQGSKYSLRIRHTYCFYTVTVVQRMCVIVTLYIYCTLQLGATYLCSVGILFAHFNQHEVLITFKLIFNMDHTV
jgi:hypothetical protein